MFAPEGCVVILPALFDVIVFHCPLSKRLQYLIDVEIQKRRKGKKKKNIIESVLSYPFTKIFQLR